MKKTKLYDVLAVLIPVGAVVLNALPNAVMMKWMGGYTTYCSGFSFLPVGYAIWGPMLAGVAAIVVCLLALVRLLRKKTGKSSWMVGLSAFSALMALSTLLFDSMTVIGGLVAVLMALECLLALYLAKK